MKSIPYVIDNQQHKMQAVLAELLADHTGRSLDVATAYFNVGGFRLLQSGLQGLGSLRLLLGAEPKTAVDLGLRARKQPRHAANLLESESLGYELQTSPFNATTQAAVKSLIVFLSRPEVEVRLYGSGFLHAKSYIFYGDKPGSRDRLNPSAAIVGSSNLTTPGLTSNRELNLAHKSMLSDDELNLAEQVGQLAFFDINAAASDPASSTPQQLAQRRQAMSSVGATAMQELSGWFERNWAASHDYKAELIQLLVGSQFVSNEYTPYQIYTKALFEYFRDELEQQEIGNTRSVVNLAEFQEDAVKKARRILARYDGVLIADSVGLGKTWIGKKLLEDYAYHQRQKAVVICPAALRPMWQHELKEATIAAEVISQEELGRDEFDATAHMDTDVVLIDESHNFRNGSSGRYQNLERLLGGNGRRGRAGERKKLIMLSATPINNTIFDLYSQINLFTGNDLSYFAGAGIGDLKNYFLAARRQPSTHGEAVALFNLLEEVVIRRTRPFIRKAYPEAVIEGETVRWPERRLRTIPYNLEATYPGIYADIVGGVSQLTLAPYNLEQYKKGQTDVFELGREQALVGIFKTRYLKRFESSVAAFRISVRRALQFSQTFREYLLGGKLVSSRDFRKLTSYIAAENDEDDATPQSRADEIDAHAEARKYLDSLPTLDMNQYDLRAIDRALQTDIGILERIWQQIKGINPEQDAKLNALKDLLAGEMRGQKVLIFSYYKDTVRYVYQQLCGGSEATEQWRAAAGNPHVRRMDSGNNVQDRGAIVAAFTPTRNGHPEWVGTEKEINILIATDVLSEGQNLQECGILINYDLHWNPTRMVQRAGRIDRIGSPFDTLEIANVFPEEGLEELLGLVKSLNDKISQIDNSGFLDTSILGEVVHPQNFNTLKRIQAEDSDVLEEQEQFAELATSEFMLRQIREWVAAQGREALEQLPDGIHSGKDGRGARGMFFYFTADNPDGESRQHYWRYYDAQTDRITDNRYQIADLIQCALDTPRQADDQDPFAVQEKVIADILRSAERQVALEEAPKKIDAVQNNIIATLRLAMSNPALRRAAVIAAITNLSQPLANVYLKELKQAYNSYANEQDVAALLAEVNRIVSQQARPTASSQHHTQLQREDLHLVCFDHIC